MEEREEVEVSDNSINTKGEARTREVGRRSTAKHENCCGFWVRFLDVSIRDPSVLFLIDKEELFLRALIDSFEKSGAGGELRGYPELPERGTGGSLSKSSLNYLWEQK